MNLIKNTPSAIVSHLTIDAVRGLLEQISTKTRHGRRNLTMLLLLRGELSLRYPEWETLFNKHPDCLWH